MTTNWIAIAISLTALVVSVGTAWFTLLRRGELKMTQPTVVFFGPDGGASRENRKRVKVFLRTLLFSTSKRGQTIESMYVNVQRGESRQNFSIWVYGERLNLSRGSGLFVPQEGVAYNHHFLLPADGSDYQLLAGSYRVRVYAKKVGARPTELAAVTLQISQAQAEQLWSDDAGIYFDWGPDQQAYHAHVDARPPMPVPEFLVGPAQADLPTSR